MGFRVLTELERKRFVSKLVEIDVPRQIIVEQDQAAAAAVINTVTESISAPSSSKSKGNSNSSSICGDPTVASNHNDLSGSKRGRDTDLNTQADACFARRRIEDVIEEGNPINMEQVLRPS